MAGDVSFNAFVVSLATTAAVHFGDIADPATGRPGRGNLEAAGQAIEMLALLETKTSGNLTETEAAFLQQVLFELRMRFVEEKKKRARSVASDDGTSPGDDSL